MLRAEDVKRSIDPFTGQVSLGVALIDLPGRNGLHARVGASYSSAVRRTVTGWNQEEPTGVLGLGWSLALDRIVIADNMSALNPDRKLYIKLGGLFSRLTHTGKASDGAWTYGCENYVFWQIKYYPDEEKWVILDENGITYVFGDTSSGRSTVDWTVAWGGWSGPSGQTANQKAIATSWSLSVVSNSYGDRVVYAYSQDSLPVSPGGVSYTRATYLASVTGVDGTYALFQYAEKDAVEYQNPHDQSKTTNAWQDRYQTRYLARIDTARVDGQPLDTVVFGYAPQFLGSGILSKRLLTSIGLYSDKNDFQKCLLVEPAVQFSFWGQSVDDGVSATQIYNAQNGAYYGALKLVKLPFGGTATYCYAAKTPEYSARSLPVVSTSTATSPRLYFSDDCVFVTWLDGGTVRLHAYAWEGRWLKKEIATLVLGQGLSYDDVMFGHGRDCCALLAGASLVVIGRDLTNPGAWLAPSTFTVPLGSGEKGALAVGCSFACVLGLTSGSLYPYRLIGNAWQADGALSVGAAGSGFAIAAKGSLVVATAIPASGGATPVTLLMREGNGKWAKPTLATLDLGGLAGSGNIVMGAGFATIYAAQTISGGQTVRYGAVWWDAVAENVQGEAWLSAAVALGVAPAAPVIAGACVSLLGRLFRFVGEKWVSFDPNSVVEPGAKELVSTSTGPDLFARLYSTATQGNQCADLLVFNPASQKWSNPAALSAAGLAPLAAVACNSVGGYAAIGSKLWHQMPDGSWSSVMTLPSGLSADDMATLRIVADRFVILQQNTGGPSPNTLVFMLANGSVVSATPVSLVGQKFVFGTASALVGSHSFATYTGVYGAGSSTLTLYRPLVGDVSGAQITYVAATLKLDNGYGSLSGSCVSLSALDYNQKGATIDETGLLPKFNQTTSIPDSTRGTNAGNLNNSGGYVSGCVVFGYFNGLSGEEIPAEPWPDSSYSNALSHASVVQGIPYVQRFCDHNSAAIALRTTYWQVTVGTLGEIGRSAYSRAIRSEDMCDGVTGVALVTYLDNTGLPSEETVQTYNAAGTVDAYTAQYTYWWQIYDTERKLNLLTPVVQTKQLMTPAGGAPVTTGIYVQTWRSDWGHDAGQWAPDRTCIATSGTAAAFNAWQPTDSMPSGYLLQCRVLSRTSAGLPIAVCDALNRISSVSYDASQTYSVASVNNCPADPTMFVWFGCEPYESSGPWSSSDPARSIWSFVSTADFHTGSQCLALPPNTAAGPLLQVRPSDQTRAYVFSCWARAPKAFAPGAGVAAWTIQPYDPANGQAVGQAVAMVLTPLSGAPTAVSDWEYFQVAVDLPTLVATAGKALGLRISAANANNAQPCYIDELRFMPLDCDFNAQVYELPRWRPQAAVNTIGQSAQLRYDPVDRPYLAVAAYDRVTSLEAYSYARALTASDTFYADFPNARLRLSTSGKSRYYDFHDGNTGDWAFSDASWSITNGELVYTGGGAGIIGATAILTRYAYTYFAASLRLASQPTGGVKVAFGNGDVYMQWDSGASLWKLIRVSGDTVTVLQTNSVVPLGAQWLFAAIDGWVLCFANATQIFAYQYTLPSPLPPNYGSVHIATTGAACFDDVVVLESPQLRFSFIDGMQNPQQALDFLGVQPLAGSASQNVYSGQPVSLAQGVFLDGLARPAVQRLSLMATVQMSSPPSSGSSAIVKGGVDDYLRNAKGEAVSQQQYLSGTDGFTYSSTEFEPSPLSRVTKMVRPRASGSDASRYAIEANYGASVTVGGDAVIGSGKYRISTAAWVQGVDAGGVSRRVMQRITRDSLGRILMRQEGPSGGTLRQTGFGYDSAGRLSTIYQPNYYAPPGTSVPDAWKETITYNFTGLVVSHQSPDRGQVRAMYDSVGRRRFVLDANGAALTPPCILYTKYDNLDRPVETGYIRDATYSWNDALQAKADVAAFPIIAAQPSGGNEALGAWRKRYAYDGGKSGAARFLLGKLTKVSINQNGDAVAPDIETYQYDAYGNMTSKTAMMPGVSPETGWTVMATYNGQNRMASLTYPTLDADAPLVAICYDREGRIASIGKGSGSGAIVDPSNPPSAVDRRWALYDYDLFGRLSGISYNNPLVAEDGAAVPYGYAYDDAQRLSLLGGSYFLESLSYDRGDGIGGWSYYDGTIAAAASQYLPNDKWSPAISGFVQQFQYDAHGQLISETNTLGDAFTISLGGARTYDANGNVLTSARGRTATTWTYAGTTATATNRLLTVASAVNAVVNFNAVPPGSTSFGGWIWGSSNGGPSASALIQTAQDSSSGTVQVLRLAGGGLGHYEVLRLATYLQPHATYTLSWQAMTDTGYGQASGGSHWYLVLYAESGPSLAFPLGDPLAATTWLTGQLTFTPATLARTYGCSLPLVAASVELRNQGRNADCSPGPSIVLAVASVTGSDAGGAYVCDNNGSVIAAPDRNISALTYDPVTRLTASVSMDNGASLHFAYGSNNKRSRAMLIDNAQSVQSTVVTLTGMRGEVLATQSNGAVNYYLHGPDGAFGLLSGGKLKLLLRDHLGSPRVAVDAVSGSPVSAGDYMPFGDAQRRTASSGTDVGYTGQRLDALSGLYNFNARLYDPALGRFYATDAADQYASPYVYVGNNPLSFTDPSGDIACSTIAFLAGGVAFGSMYLFSPEIYSVFEQEGKAYLDHYVKESIPKDGVVDRALYPMRWIRRLIAQVFKNVSHQEMLVMRDYPYENWSSWLGTHEYFRMTLGPVRFVTTLMWVYRPVEADIGRKWESKEKQNAARHSSYMCRAVRAFGGGTGFAYALGMAHEEGRPGWGIVGLTDGVADKLNNAIASYKSLTFPERDCNDLFDESWGPKGGLQGILSLNGEDHAPTIDDQRHVVLQSYLRSMHYLTNLGIELPQFTDEERVIIDEALSLDPTLSPKFASVGNETVVSASPDKEDL